LRDQILGFRPRDSGVEGLPFAAFAARPSRQVPDPCQSNITNTPRTAFRLIPDVRDIPDRLSHPEHDLQAQHGRLPDTPVLDLDSPFSAAGSLGFGFSRTNKPGWTPVLKESTQFELTRRSIQENFEFSSRLQMKIDHLVEVEAAKTHAFEVRNYGEIRTGLERYRSGSQDVEVPPASQVKAAALARGIARLEAEQGKS
jgi:hypothetical protein